jgi:thymidine kinase
MTSDVFNKILLAENEVISGPRNSGKSRALAKRAIFEGSCVVLCHAQRLSNIMKDYVGEELTNLNIAHERSMRMIAYGTDTIEFYTVTDILGVHLGKKDTILIDNCEFFDQKLLDRIKLITKRWVGTTSLLPIQYCKPLVEI